MVMKHKITEVAVGQRSRKVIPVAVRFNHFIRHTTKALKAIRSDASLTSACWDIAECHRNGKTVVTTGMGKAGHIAQKAASILSSLGIRSIYLHPGEASHGDIGVVGDQDVILAFSTSGKTREVLETIRLARHIAECTVISITSHPDGKIRKCSDLVVDMGAVEEAGYLEIAPTTSTTVMQVLADFIAVTSAEIIGTTMEEYSLRHHGGYLGQKSRESVYRKEK